MSPDMRATLLDWLTDGSFDGIVIYQPAEDDQQTLIGRIAPVTPPARAHTTTHVRVQDTTRGDIEVPLDAIANVAVLLRPQPACQPR